jgi:peptidoglycan/xylan/chitin deacetylase (PgdA/CDA1 family)
MRNDVVWQPLRDELSRWVDEDRTVRFWLRDDDAVEPAGALEELLALSKDYEVPVLLAVIPSYAGKPLAERLKPEKLATIAVHGWSHVNHANEGEKKQELGSHRPLKEVLAELEEGKRKIEELFPGQALPVLVPPWNRIDGSLLPHLRALEFAALSVFGSPKENQAAHITLMNTHVDLMDWHGTRSCRDHGELVAETVREIQSRLGSEDSAVGILGHHLVHDESAWSFLKTLFEVTIEAGGCHWVAARNLL